MQTNVRRAYNFLVRVYNTSRSGGARNAAVSEQSASENQYNIWSSAIVENRHIFHAKFSTHVCIERPT